MHEVTHYFLCMVR